MSEGARARAAGLAAAAAWIAFCLSWFDGPARATPWWSAVPPALPAAILLAAGAGWAWLRRAELAPLVATASPRGLVVAVAAALAFRLPLLWHGSAGYVTADGALSGIVALRIRAGLDHLVFVPHVPYSGSLKSHLAALLGFAMDMPRAFALASVLFYCVFVAAAFLIAERAWRRSDLALAAGLYLAFAPAFVTRYSLSNDGNYVEILALGSMALLAIVAWKEDAAARALPALAGVLLGLASWCHILAVIPGAAVAILALAAGRPGIPAVLKMAAGAALGYVPGLIWNAGNDWGSFRYLLPGSAVSDDKGGLLVRLVALFSDQAIVLAGYDFGYDGVASAALVVAAIVALACAVWAVVVARSRVAGSPA